MEKLSHLEKRIFNEGERLIPGYSHDIAELIRHRSSYIFFKKVIELDVENGRVSDPIRIVDLGCGVGHGCYTLSEIPGAQILGVDISPESLEYAKTYYAKSNVSYQFANLQEYIPAMPEFDYAVSRHAFEHMSNGLNLAMSTRWRNRLLFEVPYDEPAGRNPYHELVGIHEMHYTEFPEAEIFFQDLYGIIYDLKNKPLKPNGIICVKSRHELLKISSGHIIFPLPAWRPEDREYKHLVEKYLDLQQEHQALKQKHQALRQSKAVILARKLGEHPIVLKMATTGYGVLAKIYHWLGGR